MQLLTDPGPRGGQCLPAGRSWSPARGQWILDELTQTSGHVLQGCSPTLELGKARSLGRYPDQPRGTSEGHHEPVRAARTARRARWRTRGWSSCPQPWKWLDPRGPQEWAGSENLKESFRPLQSVTEPLEGQLARASAQAQTTEPPARKLKQQKRISSHFWGLGAEIKGSAGSLPLKCGRLSSLWAGLCPSRLFL